MALELTNDNFDKVVNSEKVVLVDFWASWCMPCKMMAPILEEMTNEYDENKVAITKCDVQSEPQIAQKFSIVSIPTMLIFKDGKVMDQIIGVSQKQVLLDKINQYL
ncbi:MAG: thioredoxin [Candidatus Cloacimonetes bacterium]|nr:thioredoxin [Candidatus Cloacimonadota bacterium]MBL7108374.1 thioredoxin [Candidatus Cloacimonadota bacterium]